MSDTICNREECYERDVEEYRRNESQQLAFDFYGPDPDEIFEHKVSQLKDHIWQIFKGRTSNRLRIHAELLPDWFGRVKGKHLTQALREMEEEGSVTKRTGASSHPYSQFTFRRP